MGEQQYLDLVRDVIETGESSDDRTGVGTLFKLGATCRYSLLGKTLPLFTTKFVSLRNIVLELKFFLRGLTNSKWLEERGCNIWKGNSSRAFLDSQGKQHYEEGELGAIYGKQWRDFGGIDQLKEVIEAIKKNPESRRLIISAWNPPELGSMVLPPCHVLFQFRVTQKKNLSCIMYQRSADLGLGVPYNVASYSILTHLIAHLTGLEAKEFIHVMADCHVYKNHVDVLK
jgi:thymidylate synthase